MPPKAAKRKELPQQQPILARSSSHPKIGRNYQMDNVMKKEKEDNFCQFPHFFKAYMPHSSSQRMKLPPGLGQRISEGRIPRKLFLRSRRGKRFSVGLGSRGNDLFFEGEGWAQFVRDNSLVENHMLVFFFDGTDTFDFKIFELNGCEKIGEGEEEEETPEVKVEVVEVVEEIDEAEEEEEEEEAEENEIGKRKKKIDIYGADIFKSGAFNQPVNPYFVTKVKQNRAMVHIPNDVVKELESLEYELPEKLKVRDPRGRYFTLRLNAWADGRIWYGDGWIRLCKSNLVKEDDNIICEFIKRDQIQMQISVICAGN